MATRYSVACDDDQARAVSQLAHRYDTTEEDVLRQLIDVGLDSIDN